MTTLTDRPGTALVVIDAQNGVVTGTHERDAVVANIAALVDRARAADTPVVWVLHSSRNMLRDTPEWELVPELARRDDEAVVHKTWPDPFEETDLEPVLAERGIGRLVVTGAQTDECIRSTLHGAIARGYDAVLVADAHTTEDQTEFGAPPPAQVVAHTNLYWGMHTAPGRSAGTVDTADVDFAAAPARTG